MSMSARLRSRRRTLTTPLGALLALLALGAFADLAGCRPAVPDTVKIGVAQPLSGPLKAMGQDMLDGARLAIDGKPIVFPPTTSTGFVHPDRLADVASHRPLPLVREGVLGQGLRQVGGARVARAFGGRRREVQHGIGQTGQAAERAWLVEVGEQWYGAGAAQLGPPVR